MKQAAVGIFCAAFIAGVAAWSQDTSRPRDLRLAILDPAHFHAAQLFTGPLPGFSRDARVYAPVTRELASFWTSVNNLTSRSKSPEHWRFYSYSGPDYLDRMLEERPADVVALSGRNARNIEYIDASIRGGMHVLADKPWIIEAKNLRKLEAVLAEARKRNLVAYDCMTQRFDIAYQLQRELVNDPELFGLRIAGTPDKPGVEMVSSHFLLKTFNGVPNLRPAWYFDVRQLGEALADVGTHVVDLTHWTLFPDQALDYRKDIRLLAAKRWPTVLTLRDFQRVTGEQAFPTYLQDQLREGNLQYFVNNTLLYTVRGTHVGIRVTWEYESPAGDRDSMLAIYRGSKAEVAVRAGREQKFLPEVDVVPAPGSDPAAVRKALEARVAALQSRWPGLSVRESGGRYHVTIPQSLRINDVEYFLLLAQQFAEYVRNPKTLPAHETANLIARYYITTHGVELARRSTPQ